MSIILNAARLAAHCHRNQKRGNSGRPYLTHLIRVAGRAATIPGMTEADVAGGFLHDVLEDQASTPEVYAEIRERIQTECGKDVYYIVVDLTNPSKSSSAPRAERKRLDRAGMASRTPNVKIIKLIDRIDNVNEFIMDYVLGLFGDPWFLRQYADESELLLKEALTGVNQDLELELADAIKRLRDWLPT